MGKGHSANDHRSNSMNPNNAAFKASQDNKSMQLNPNNERNQGKKDEDDE